MTTHPRISTREIKHKISEGRAMERRAGASSQPLSQPPLQDNPGPGVARLAPLLKEAGGSAQTLLKVSNTSSGTVCFRADGK